MATVSDKVATSPTARERPMPTGQMTSILNAGRLAEIIKVMGGERLIGHVESDITVHDLITEGFPTGSALHFLDRLTVVDSTDAAKAMGVSLRTIQRLKKKGADERLSPDQSDRTWQFAEVLARATEVFGTQEAAEHWLNEQAIGLNQRRPIDLLATTIGTEAVKTYLDRMDYGVYA